MVELKPKLSELEGELETKRAEATQLAEKKVELETQLGNMKEEHQKELNALKEEYEKKIEQFEDKIGLSPEKADIPKDVEVIFLRYTGEEFRYVRHQPEDGMYLILDQQEEKWLLVWDASVSFIDRKSGERLARSIAKAGWPLADGGRIGFAFELELQGEKTVPERLLRDQHEYMD